MVSVEEETQSKVDVVLNNMHSYVNEACSSIVYILVEYILHNPLDMTLYSVHSKHKTRNANTVDSISCLLISLQNEDKLCHPGHVVGLEKAGPIITAMRFFQNSQLQIVIINLLWKPNKAMMEIVGRQNGHRRIENALRKTPILSKRVSGSL